MRIGILTLPLHTNYGGILQAWALQTVLERIGHDVKVIDKVPYKKEVSWLRLVIRAFQKFILGRKTIHIFNERDFNRSHSPQAENRVNTNKFINEYIKIAYVYDINEIKADSYDAIVVGSDQIWRPKYLIEPFNEDVTPAFLSFAASWSIDRIAYAASFGTDVWEFSDEETHKVKELAKRFKAISVREDSGVRLCQENLGVEATHVLDPTMLLEEKDYDRIAQKGKIPHGDMMCHILDKTAYKNDVIAQIAKARGLVPFNINEEDVIKVQPPVEDWLQGLKHSRMVITDSFHACVFSIIYHKPFIAINNSSRGSARMTSLLTMFGLENRLIETDTALTQEFIHSSVDFKKVDSLLEEWRKKSLSFLKTNLAEQL